MNSKIRGCLEGIVGLPIVLFHELVYNPVKRRYYEIRGIPYRQYMGDLVEYERSDRPKKTKKDK